MPGDVGRIALRIDKLKALGFKPRLDSRNTVYKVAVELRKELNYDNIF